MTHLTEDGVDRRFIQDTVGHRCDTSTAIYTRVSGDFMNTALRKALTPASRESDWLFPGGQPGRPISAYRLGERLHELGTRPGQVRASALFQLATELPAAVLARMLGIHITVAVAWQRASSGDWTTYAADLARRPR